MADSVAKRIAAATPPSRPQRPSAAYAQALGVLPLHQIGSQQPLGVSPAYRKLAQIIAESASEGGRRTVLVWPASEISLAAGAILTCLADCLSATPLQVEFDGEPVSALSAPIGLRTLLFPAASTVHRPLKDVYADKDTISRCHTRHHARAIRQPAEAGLADYHQALSRVKTLTGRARDGKVYDEFRHPNLDEVVASGPLNGPVAYRAPDAKPGAASQVACLVLAVGDTRILWLPPTPKTDAQPRTAAVGCGWADFRDRVRAGGKLADAADLAAADRVVVAPRQTLETMSRQPEAAPSPPARSASTR